MGSNSNLVVQLTAPTHFPIKLTSLNFAVWRKQIQSTLIGLDLLQFLDGTQKPPSKFLDAEKKTTNPAYTQWYRQDQTLLSAILGSCSDMIQPLISSAESSAEAWKRLSDSYANSSRSRIISLKAKLAKNPKGNKSVAEFLNEMRSIAGELALTQNPVSEEDLVVHIITQLGDEFNPIVAAIKVRESSITYSELFDKLTDFERLVKEKDSTSIPIIPTVNATQRQNPKAHQIQKSFQGYQQNYRKSRGGYNGNTYRSSQSQNGNRSYRADSFCQFCEIAGHNTCDCRKLAKFLKENNISIVNTTSPSAQASPVVNATSVSSSTQQPWLFDSGASHHATSNLSSLHTYADYGGPVKNKY